MYNHHPRTICASKLYNQSTLVFKLSLISCFFLENLYCLIYYPPVGIVVMIVGDFAERVG
ncbi:hypothetical protein BDZ94DRAFT_1248972 [Collybia nuda]|uniref:Uncharacterized protein n=1 Tax=Collybia nuda TaxID=64659 RepID=A0A9P5YEA2_9AGAR|nr:hypothetical protein BDZ94DRAFT_1248972 [Collybia nuda]